MENKLNIKEYLDKDEQKDLLRLLTAGSVDDGKSTLIGRLLFDSKKLYEDQLAALERDSKRVGNAGDHIDYALLCDGLKAEREQGITIDVAYRYFSTNNRKFIIADTPGHEQYTRNMITGGSTANLAIILVDARLGVITQTCRHTFLVSLLGIKHVVLAVNKMDLVGFSEERFNEIVTEYKKFVEPLGIPDVTCIPLSALDGDNVVQKSERTPWYKGTSLLELLETVSIENDHNLTDFRFPVQYVLRPNLDFRGFCGKIASGVIHKGDEVMALPSGKKSHIKSIVTYDGELEYAFPPQAVTLTLEDEIDVSRGDMLVHADNVPVIDRNFEAMLVWMWTPCRSCCTPRRCASSSPRAAGPWSARPIRPASPPSASARATARPISTARPTFPAPCGTFSARRRSTTARSAPRSRASSSSAAARPASARNSGSRAAIS